MDESQGAASKSIKRTESEMSEELKPCFCGSTKVEYCTFDRPPTDCRLSRVSTPDTSAVELVSEMRDCLVDANSELPEVKALVEALRNIEIMVWADDFSERTKLDEIDRIVTDALAPFTAKNNPASLSPVDCPSGNGDAQTASMSSHAAPEDAQDGGVK